MLLRKEGSSLPRSLPATGLDVQNIGIERKLRIVSNHLCFWVTWSHGIRQRVTTSSSVHPVILLSSKGTAVWRYEVNRGWLEPRGVPELTLSLVRAL